MYIVQIIVYIRWTDVLLYKTKEAVYCTCIYQRIFLCVPYKAVQA